MARPAARADGPAPSVERIAPRAWLVFAVSFGLLLSDYMSRQVLAAVFPQLKAEWLLTDAKLGALGGAVALMVGVLTFPLSLLADRIGRVRSVIAMAFTWSLATLACGLCASYGQLMAARLALGVGEAAYASVGLAVVFTYFPQRLRATISAAFMAGGVFGSFTGVALGGAIAAHASWRGAFAAMGVLGFVLTGLYALILRGPRATAPGETQEAAPRLTPRALAAGVFAAPAVNVTYLANGLQLFVLGALTAWTPSYLNRTMGVTPQAAAGFAALLLLASGVGMIACGRISDRLCAANPGLRPWLAASFALLTFLGLQAALAAPVGPAQFACAAIGFFCAGGTTGPAGAIVADGAPPALHGSALAVMSLAMNLIGLAPGPAVTGLLADRLGLHAALQVGVCAALLSAAAFALSGRLRQPKPHNAA
jgi:MFS family permease